MLSRLPGQSWMPDLPVGRNCVIFIGLLLRLSRRSGGRARSAFAEARALRAVLV